MATVALLATLVAGPSRAQEPEATSPSLDVMMELSKAFRGLEKAVLSDDEDETLRYRAGMCKAASRIHELEPQKNRDLSTVFRQMSARLCELVAEMETAESVTGPAARELLESVRRQCVSCHVVFRTRNTPDRFYPANGNTIWGRVRIEGSDGEPRDHHGDVVVFVDGVRTGDFSPPVRRPSISQKGRRFTPRVLPVVRGTTVDFPNDDSIFHNVFSLSKACCFDLDIYAKGTSKSVTFPKPGLVRVYCNIHPDMIGNILVLNNPYFAVSDSHGFYVITEIPDGEYSLRSWYEFGDETRTPLTVSGGELVEHPITVRETVKSIQHKNKFGKPYPGKYR